MSILFSPLKLKHQELPNRIVVSPMCQYSAVEGYANEFHLVHLGQFAAGKAGLILQEATAVVPEGRISYGDLGIWEDAQIPALQRIVDYVHSQGALIGLQLAHAGRKASTEIPWIGRQQLAPQHQHGWQTVAPSALSFHAQDHPPLALSSVAIEELVLAFKESARRAVRAGYDVIEIHAAHGYLIHQFLSPLVNQREDAYGGSFENRIRFLLSILRAVQEVLTTQSLWLRISATDWAEGGWNLEESIALSSIVKEMGVEILDVSTGGAVHHQDIPVQINYQVPFSDSIKKESAIRTGTVGLIQSGVQAEEILQQGAADLILIGRAFLQNPHLPYAFAEELQHHLDWAPQYERGKETL